MQNPLMAGVHLNGVKFELIVNSPGAETGKKGFHSPITTEKV